jgi:hypothetical protein
MFPFNYDIQYYISYLLNKHITKDIEKDNLVVFYDNFSEEHGDIIVQTFLNKLNNKLLDKYEIIKIDSSDIRVEVFELLMIDLLEEGKQVYLNSSVSPRDGVYAYRWNLAYQHLLQYKNIIITQSVGNNINTAKYLKSFTDKGNEIDEEIYSLMNDKVDNIKEIVLTKDIEQLLIEYGYFAWPIIGIKSNLGFDRNDKMRHLVYETISPLLLKYNLQKKQDEIIDVYTSIINSFSHAILISNNNGKVIQVGSSSQLDSDVGTNSFLDFRIKNLIDIDVRENAVTEINGKEEIGTSLSSPTALADIINKLNKSDS